MNLIVALSHSIDAGWVKDSLRAGGWSLKYQPDEDSSLSRFAAVFSPNEFQDCLATLVASDPEARVVVAFRPIEIEFAIAFASGTPANEVLQNCRKFLKDVLKTFRQNRLRTTLVAVGLCPSSTATLAQVLAVPTVIPNQVSVDPILRILVRSLLGEDQEFRRFLEELQASAVGRLEERQTLSLLEVIELWGASLRSAQLRAAENAILETRLLVAEASVAAEQRLTEEREACRHEIELLYEQLRTSQRLIDELEASLDQTSFGISREPRLKHGVLFESVNFL